MCVSIPGIEARVGGGAVDFYDKIEHFCDKIRRLFRVQDGKGMTKLTT